MSVPSEHAEQVTFVNQFEREWPGVRIFAIPNGGFRSMTTAKKLREEGVRAGVPDLFIPAYQTWIEMKRTVGSRLSPEQKDWIAYLEAIGHIVIVAKGWRMAMDEVRKIIER